MAANSKRERILQDIITAVEGLAWVGDIVREQPAEPGDLADYAQSQFPLVAVVGQLPRPQQTRRAGKGREYVSELEVGLFVYAMEARTPDTELSSLADDLWRVCLADPTRNGTATDTQVLPETEKATYSPYVAFSLVLSITYIHDATGI